MKEEYKIRAFWTDYTTLQLFELLDANNIPKYNELHKKSGRTYKITSRLIEPSSYDSIKVQIFYEQV
jgi:hypothetical protein